MSDIAATVENDALDLGPVPEGFVPHFIDPPATRAWNPIYSQLSNDKILIGFFVRATHCNSGGVLHGGVVATMCDNAMALSMAKIRGERADAVTIRMSIDYIGPAVPGQWLEFDTSFKKRGRRLCFTQCWVTADGKIIARADGVFAIKQE